MASAELLTFKVRELMRGVIKPNMDGEAMQVDMQPAFFC
jgi:hypothetical protein